MFWVLGFKIFGIGILQRLDLWIWSWILMDCLVYLMKKVSLVWNYCDDGFLGMKRSLEKSQTANCLYGLCRLTDGIWAMLCNVRLVVEALENFVHTFMRCTYSLGLVLGRVRLNYIRVECLIVWDFLWFQIWYWVFNNYD